MKIAYLLLVHTNPAQVNQLINALTNGKNHLFLHVDKKSDIQNEINKAGNVHLIKQPYSVKWGDFSLVEATIALCRQALDYPEDFDYVILLSGQDYPIKSNSEIEDFLKLNKGKQFFKVRKLPYQEWQHHAGGIDRLRVYYPKYLIDRSYRTWYLRKKWIKLSRKLGLTRKVGFFKTYYGVSQWFCASSDAIEYIIGYLDKNPKVPRFFKNTFIPDEILFNTIIMNSPFKDSVVPNDQRLVEWTNGNENPRVWRKKDLDHLLSSEFLFARKFDTRKDKEILNLLDEKRSQ